MEISSLQSSRKLGFAGQGRVRNSEPQPPTDISSREDKLTLSEEAPSPPKIGYLQVLFKRLSNEQIKQVNKSRMLPKNAKFVWDNEKQRYKIRANFLGLRVGTRKIPEGFELKKSLLGFTIIVPEGTSGLFIRDAK